MVDHYGIIGGGHYVASVRHMNSDKWYLFDDTNVKEQPELSSQETIVSSAAYILFYRAKVTPKTPTSPRDPGSAKLQALQAKSASVAKRGGRTTRKR